MCKIAENIFFGVIRPNGEWVNFNSLDTLHQISNFTQQDTSPCAQRRFLLKRRDRRAGNLRAAASVRQLPYSTKDFSADIFLSAAFLCPLSQAACLSG